MRTRAWLAMLAIGLAGSVWGRLGENEKQIVKRYSNPAVTWSTEQDGADTVYEFYNRTDVLGSIVVTVFDPGGGVIAGRMKYGFQSEPSMDTINGLLEQNAEGSRWVSCRDEGNGRDLGWKREDGGSAFLGHGGTGFLSGTAQLVISSARYNAFIGRNLGVLGGQPKQRQDGSGGFSPPAAAHQPAKPGAPQATDAELTRVQAEYDRLLAESGRVMAEVERLPAGDLEDLERKYTAMDRANDLLYSANLPMVRYWAGQFKAGNPSARAELKKRFQYAMLCSDIEAEGVKNSIAAATNGVEEARRAGALSVTLRAQKIEGDRIGRLELVVRRQKSFLNEVGSALEQTAK